MVDLFTMDEFRLTRDDADFVEVIHTNSGVYGEYPQIGHVDFSVNGGRMQPICTSQANIIRNIYIFITVNNNIYITLILYNIWNKMHRANITSIIGVTKKLKTIIVPK